jgi:hypothetical protein
MSTGPVKTLAAHAARSVGRRLRARREGARVARRVRGHAEPPPPPPSVPLPQAPREPEAAELSADAAELDALRGALVRELDRLAAGDDCSASFRRG